MDRRRKVKLLPDREGTLHRPSLAYALYKSDLTPGAGSSLFKPKFLLILIY
jgi:hypothetical protein